MFLLTVLTAQITDKNFKEQIGSGFVLVKFTAPYQYANLDSKLFDDIKGHEGCVVIEAKSDDVKKVVKKLRIRNFPSIALFHDGSKKEVWKADMDGEVDVSTDEIRSAIDDVLAEDVF
jgi:thioredoxin-like negative regulator of GroEL